MRYSVHVQSICDAVDVPHLEIHPTLDSAATLLHPPMLLAKAGNWRQNKRLTTKLIELQRFSINVQPRLEDVNLAYKDLVLYRKWTRVAILYTGKRDGRLGSDARRKRMILN